MWPGKRMPGRMGGKRVTTPSLKVSVVVGERLLIRKIMLSGQFLLYTHTHMSVIDNRVYNSALLLSARSHFLKKLAHALCVCVGRML